MQVSLVIPVTPVPWQRPRSRNTVFFDAQKKTKAIYAIHLERLFEEKPFETALEVSYVFYVPLPVRPAKDHLQYHGYSRFKPDIDNLVKFITDAANGILWKDDNLISIIHACKVFDPMPRTEITIKEIAP